MESDKALIDFRPCKPLGSIASSYTLPRTYMAGVRPERREIMNWCLNLTVCLGWVWNYVAVEIPSSATNSCR